MYFCVACLHGSWQNKPRLLVSTQTQRLSTAQMRRGRHARPYALVSLQYRAWLAFGLLCWLRVLTVLTNLVFWGLAERLFNVRQGKRLFSLIGSGELAASILGGFATPLVVPVLGTHNLLLGSALSLIACLGLLLVTLRTCTAALTTPAEAEPTAQATPHSLTHLLKQRYVVLIFLVQMLLVLVYYFVDFTFLAQTKAHYQTEA